MIDSIFGKLKEKAPHSVVIDVNGIRYRILITISTFSSLPELNSTLELLTFLHVRDDGMELFGFGSHDERTMYMMLKNVSGIGPKSALNILSGAGVTELRQSIISGNVNRLVAIPGIGSKTAKRIILELKDKFVTDSDDNIDFITQSDSKISEDIAIALLSLGYKRPQINQVLKKLEAKGEVQGSMEDIIKKALKML